MPVNRRSARDIDALEELLGFGVLVVCFSVVDRGVVERSGCSWSLHLSKLQRNHIYVSPGALTFLYLLSSLLNFSITIIFGQSSSACFISGMSEFT